MYFPSTSKKPSSAIEKDENSITGKFDPTALERGAKALKELDSSPNSSKAFDIIKMQEQTKQKEIQAQIEKTVTERQSLAAQKAQIEGEERRKTIQEQTEQARRMAEYQAKLDAELSQKKAQDQLRQNEEFLRQQHEQFMRQESMRKKTDMEIEEARRKTLAEQARIAKETEVARVKAEAEGRTEQERANVDIRLQEMRAKMAEKRQTSVETLNITLSSLGSGFTNLMADKQRLTALVLATTGIFAGLFAAKQGSRVAATLIERSLGKPPLVRETSRWTFSPSRWLQSLFKKENPQLFEKIVLEETLAERLQWTTNSLVNARKNKTPFRHLLLYGPPGTGKTLFARTLARQSGLDYAIMTGGDVGPLGKDAVDELNKLFKWASGRKNGMILFIDEADAFLRQGRGLAPGASGGMSEDMRNVLSAFLHHTGTESNRIMVVLATNCRDVLDRAVLDRMDEEFEFPRPGLEQRRQMLNMFMKEHITERMAVDPDVVDPKYIDDVAIKTEGFSGRQMSKLVLAFQSAVYGSGAKGLTKGMADTVLNWKLEHFEMDQKHSTPAQ
jgi:ATPase family AAA domain-containing protein 3A/B